MFYFLGEDISYLSKKEVGESFFIGMFSVARQSLFVDRSKQDEREAAMDGILTRANRGLKGELPSLLIFPEGTVSNGRVLMKFKKGAFSSEKPIKIFTLIYKGQVVPSLINVHPLSALILAFSDLSNSLEVCEIREPLDPMWVYKKHNIKHTDPQAWEKVASEAKNIISFLTGYQQHETSFRDI